MDSNCGLPMKTLLVVTLGLTMLPGCALLTSQISVSHRLPKDLSGTTYAMIPFKEQEGRLGHKVYEEAVRQELNAQGFRETTLDQAETVVFFAYGIDTGKGVVSSYPIIGQTGVEACTSTSCLDSSPWPTYGVVETRKTKQIQYTRVLRLDIVDKQALAQGTIKNFTRERL